MTDFSQTMQPLTRQKSRTSIFSWWSDSNPGLRGPTINLHAATKPLLKFMYHRQASEFIQKNRSAALSNESLHVLSSYLGSKYVALSTKLMVLQVLDDKLRSTEESRRVMIDDPVGLHLVLEMLGSPSPQVRQVTCTILGRLAADESTMSTFLWNFGIKLVPLIHDEDDKVVEKAMWAFSVAVHWQSGAQVFVEFKLLDSVRELLESPRPFARMQACRLVGKLASHEHTITAVLESKLCTRLVFLLRDERGTTRDEAVWVNNAAAYALTQISRSLPGAKAVVNAKVLDHIPELLGSNTMVRDRSCELLDSLFHHEFVVPAILRLNILARLVSISEFELPAYTWETDPTNLAVSTDLLARMSRCPDAVSALAETDILDAIQRIIIRLNGTTLRANVDSIQNNIARYIESRNQTQIYRIRADWGTIQNNIARYKERNQQRHIFMDRAVSGL
ncbi:armadillo-type protein [Mycena haematopus]|nr:armadillo-type protein [Mycena haematopus]